MMVGLVSPIKTNALNSKVDSMLASMSNKDKIIKNKAKNKPMVIFDCLVPFNDCKLISF